MSSFGLNSVIIWWHRAAALVRPHCQTRFHLPPRIHSDSPAPLMMAPMWTPVVNLSCKKSFHPSSLLFFFFWCLAQRAQSTDHHVPASWAGLTGSVGADVNDFALCAVDLVLVWRRKLGLHHDGVLRPGFQREDQIPWFDFVLVPFGRAMWRVHVCDHPAVGATGVLPVKLGYVLERSVEGTKIGINKIAENYLGLKLLF